MIRINLLPSQKGGRSGGGGRGFMALALILLALEGGALFFLQSEADTEFQQLVKKNTDTERMITELKKKTAEVAQLEREKAELKRQKEVLDALIEGQSGPVNMLFELSEILRPEDDPQRKLEQANRGWNPDWDPRRLWIDGFIEKARVVKFSGHARSNEDVAELLHRLNSSRHFAEVTLQFSETVAVPELGGIKLQRFAIEALALYGPADVQRLASGELTLERKK
ncbi:MAG: PilN domain-containing protein [Myxococcales bacterium]|nr:PilN domain-containing protein [Myxococcales bacterium]MCB9545919.1 PilN domain-containing protein [Myxococcales bacterium]